MDALATVAAIARDQHADGGIPHYPNGIIDPWNHIEAAMALDVGGAHNAAAAAYRWLVEMQRPDGAWHAGYRGREVIERTLDTNFCAYFAAGAWHHYLVTGDTDFLMRVWDTVRSAIGFTLRLARPDGTIAWARDAAGDAWPGALLTSCSCIAISLRSAIAIAELVEQPQPDWELALVELENALRDPATRYEPKDNFAMDWYYPVLSGALGQEAGRARLLSRWSDFVIDERGCRCVEERPWVTSGETAELILSCLRVGFISEAERLLDWVQHLRAEDDAYWIGATHPDGTVWPREKPTWGSGAVVLAWAALNDEPATRRLFALDDVAALGSHADPL